MPYRFHRPPFFLLSALLVLLLSAGCEPTEEAAVPPAAQDTMPPVDSAGVTAALPETQAQKLMLAEFLPLGSTYREVRARFPRVDSMRVEGATASLGEATLPMRIFDRDAEVELNFDDDRLYSYYYRLDTVDCAEADSLYAYLQDFYGQEVGDFTEESQDEGGYTARTSYWSAEGFDLAATVSRQGPACRLSWGFQE